MHSIITSYLLQTSKCALPYIGFFDTEYIPAENDVLNNRILPPKEEIFFREETILLSSGLVNYISLQKNITEGEAVKLLDSFCKKLKEKLDAGEMLCFDSFGCLQKNAAGNISFRREDFSTTYYHPVPAVKVVHEDAQHKMLESGAETVSAAMGDYNTDEVVVEKSRWRVLALILAILALVTLGFSFYNHKLSTSAFGNRNHFIIKDAGETHYHLSK